MKIGDIVWQDCNSNLRVGTIVDTMVDSHGWRHLKINWRHDDMYEYWNSPKERKEFYRWDEVRPIELNRLQQLVSSVES
jgi:hypothetical protein